MIDIANYFELDACGDPVSDSSTRVLRTRGKEGGGGKVASGWRAAAVAQPPFG